MKSASVPLACAHAAHIVGKPRRPSPRRRGQLLKTRTGQGKFMGAAPHGRKASAAKERGSAANPSTVTFRRPDESGGVATEQRGRPFWAPAVLRLPDLNAPAAPRTSPGGAGNPLLGKLMWVG